MTSKNVLDSIVDLFDWLKWWIGLKKSKFINNGAKVAASFTLLIEKRLKTLEYLLSYITKILKTQQWVIH